MSDHSIKSVGSDCFLAKATVAAEQQKFAKRDATSARQNVRGLRSRSPLRKRAWLYIAG